MKNMSAKDKAFEKERVKYRHQIRDLEYTISDKNKEILQNRETINEMERKISQLEEDNKKLMKLMDMDEDKLRMLLQNQEGLSNFLTVFKHISSVSNIYQ